MRIECSEILTRQEKSFGKQTQDLIFGHHVVALVEVSLRARRSIPPLASSAGPSCEKQLTKTFVAHNSRTTSARNNLAARVSVQVRKKWLAPATRLAPAGY